MKFAPSGSEGPGPRVGTTGPVGGMLPVELSVVVPLSATLGLLTLVVLATAVTSVALSIGMTKKPVALSQVDPSTSGW